MEEEKNVVEPTTNENVETQTTEPNEVVNDKKSFTDEQKAQMTKIIQDRVNRAKKAEERKYSELVNVLSAGLGTNNLEELTKKAKAFYQEQGVEIPSKPSYNEDEERILANAEANNIINLGYDEIVSETDEMMDRGVADLSPREKLVYKTLAEKRKEIENVKALESIGVKRETIESEDFKKFTQKFKSDTSLTDIYEMYSKLQPKEDVQPMGSMKSLSKDDEIKEYYSPEEFDKLTKEQLNNPKIWNAVMQSRLKW
jgi:hypothetical protein